MSTGLKAAVQMNDPEYSSGWQLFLCVQKNGASGKNAANIKLRISLSAAI
jgi:hypothetical protein